MLWFGLSVGSALFQVLRNMVMKRLGHALDETINVWGRFTFILPFAALGVGAAYAVAAHRLAPRWQVATAGVLAGAAVVVALSYALTNRDEVNHLSPEATDAVLASRVREFAVDSDKTYLPILDASFNELYKVLNFNLRDLLSYADNYCTEVFDSGLAPKNDAGKARRFETWLRTETVEQYRSLQSRIQTDAWTVLDTAMGIQFAGTFGPGDYPVFRVNDLKSLSEDTFHKVLRSFEKHGLLDRSVREADDDEGKQTLYSVTSKGALVHYARVQTKEARVPGTVDWLKRSSQR